MACAVAALLAGAAALAQAPGQTARWQVSTEPLAQGRYRLTFTADLLPGWHLYDTRDPYNPTTVAFTAVDGAMLSGVLLDIDDHTFAQDILLTDGSAVLSGTLTWQACRDALCAAPEDWDFRVTVGPAAASAGAATRSPLWALIIEAILWGLAMLLTPCVFPMVPMTISFFLKQSAGRFKAFMYGVFIVLLYTAPICVIILLTRLLGGETVTADIFNWLATHWLPNILFFLVFMVFAASFFGAFEITLPASIVNRSDARSDRGGLVGVFFMALTLVLVSFSCTGPIVGSVLIKSTQGESWTPMVTMLAFSVAFALPFTLLALFPSLLTRLKSGSWLGSVKVVLGFIEVALGLKFLSVADQTYHWGLLDREVYLAIWIAVFTLLGLYLLGKLRFAHEEPVTHIGVVRLGLAIAVFAFVVYLLPGMVGAPLKALSGYLPPISTQDFVISPYAAAPPASPTADPVGEAAARPALRLPHGLSGYFTLDEGLAAAQASGRPVFIDITGHGCVNCREMEARVWSDPEILAMLRDDVVIVALYTDDKTRLDPADWVTTDSGKVLKDVGRVNAHIARTRFGVNAQPNYTVLSPDGTQLVPMRGYSLDIPAFRAWLRTALAASRQPLPD